jgi:hypothetical protein
MKNAEKRAVQRPADLPSAFCAEISFPRHLIPGRNRQLSHIGKASLNGPDDHGP